MTRDIKEGATNIVFLSFKGPVAEDCPKVLNAIIDSYKKFLDSQYKSVSNENFESLTERLDEYRKDLAASNEKYDDFKNRKAGSANKVMLQVPSLSAKSTRKPRR